MQSLLRRLAPPLICWFIGSIVALPAWAHPVGEEVQPANIWTAWPREPIVIALLAASGVLYAIGVRRLWRRSTPARTFARLQVGCFAAAWLVLFIALLSPIHELGEALFSIHMAQHELLMLIAAPLLVLGRPLVPMLIALPPRARSTVTSWTKRSGFRQFWYSITNPIAAWLIHGVVLWAWHVPVLYQATLESETVHGLQHTSFLISALLFWWALLDGRYGRIGYGAAVLYVFTTAVHSGILGALFTFSTHLWYPAYQGRTLSWGLTAIQDQQLGGLIMWIPAGTVFVAFGLWFLAAMLRESGKRVAYSQAAMSQRTVGRSS